MVKMYNIIKFLCDSSSISVAQMCKDIGLRQGLISDLKHGRSKSLSASNMQKIANYFQVSTDIFSEGAFEELLPNNADMQLLKEIHLKYSLQKREEPTCTDNTHLLKGFPDEMKSDDFTEEFLRRYYTWSPERKKVMVSILYHLHNAPEEVWRKAMEYAEFLIEKHKKETDSTD